MHVQPAEQVGAKSPAERLRSLDRSAGGLAVSSLAYTADISGPLDTDTLARAVGALDVAQVATATAAAEAAAREAARPVDIEEGTFRARLLRVDPQAHVLVLAFHRAAWDRSSCAGFLDDLGRRYSARAAAEPVCPRADASAPVLLDLPADRPRPAWPSFRGGRVPISIRAGVRDGLPEPLAAALVAALQVLLVRHGVPPPPELGPKMSFRSLAAAAGGPATSAAEPLLVLEEAELRLDLDGLDVSVRELDTGATEHELGIVLRPDGGGLSGHLAFARDRFDPLTAERIADRFAVLLAAAAAAPDAAALDLPLLPPAEAAVLRGGGVRTRALPDLRAHELFEAHARSRPSDPAVSHGATTVTYGELDDRANRIAERLVREGAGPDVIVGICCERSIAMVAAVVGVLKAGAAYVPLDPSYPVDRVALMLEDAGTDLVVTQPTLVDALAASGRRLLVLDDAPPPAAADTLPRRRPHELDLAYVIFTSGSTGRPKGAALHHRGLTNYVLEMVEQLRIGPGRRVLQFSSPSFDGAVAEVVGTLAGGGELVLMRDREWLEAPSFSAFLHERGINASILFPSLLAEVRPEALSGFDTLMAAGEPLPDEVVAAWGGGRRLLNAYGPTECSIVVAFSRPLAPGDPVTVGPPIPNLRVRVFDHELRPAPLGVPGELYFGGVGVGRGYVGRPGLTAARYVPDPAADKPGERLYRTGDLGRLRADGEIEVLGRIDTQVKIRGHRIELGEIENVLARHPAVGTAAVVVAKTRAGDPCIVAYVTGTEAAGAEASLREHCASQLPRYMLPSRIVPLPELPTLPNGKVDRRSLAALG